MTLITQSEIETEEEGEKLGKSLTPGTIIALYGSLGAGKTTFTRGIAKGMGIIEHISSPTFTIVNEYNGNIPLFHFDMYRIENANDLYDIGWYDYLDRGGICIVEWSENVPGAFPVDTITVHIETIGDNTRNIEIKTISKN